MAKYDKKVAPGAAFTLLMLLVGGCSKQETLTLRNKQYPLYAVGNSGISGTVFIAENQDSSFNVTVRLNSSVPDSVHVMNIYNGGQNNSSNVALKLADIKGTGGAVIGETKNIRQKVEDAGNYGSVTYDKVLQQTMVVKVFLSRSFPDSLLCRGDIGK
ncbi:MAG: hypothetical protein EOO04_16040 [Chitinophagaceae bacterium]|nr:MAG: hypothetical protein EOO04_16040 [Chitinophagaceae bacterium]